MLIRRALFSFASAASAADGRLTILVSHRFSTVRMANLIVVLQGARVAEVGSHDELMARGLQYAELYGIQAAAYRRGSELSRARDVSNRSPSINAK